MLSKEQRMKFAFLGALVVAAILRIYGLNWGLPDVFEEATPLKKAWEMWHWGSPRSVDLNPHFFNYPTLGIYLHFVVQGILFLVLKLVGAVGSAVDFRADYFIDPTHFYIAGRLLAAAFGVGTVGVAMAVGKRAGGTIAATAVGLLLAVNVFHITRSQMIEVDVPLTFFVTFSLWRMLLLSERPTLRNYIFAGVAVGLATGTKYTGALLILPFLAAHLFSAPGASAASGSIRRARSWRPLGIGALAIGVTFFLSSPYVLLDASSFLRDFSLERQHMALGHFGADPTSTWSFYGMSAAQRVIGLPAVLLAIVGLGYFTL